MGEKFDENSERPRDIDDKGLCHHRFGDTKVICGAECSRCEVQAEERRIRMRCPFWAKDLRVSVVRDVVLKNRPIQGLKRDKLPEHPTRLKELSNSVDESANAPLQRQPFGVGKRSPDIGL